jgi:hypothetical protein
MIVRGPYSSWFLYFRRLSSAKGGEGAIVVGRNRSIDRRGVLTRRMYSIHQYVDKEHSDGVKFSCILRAWHHCTTTRSRLAMKNTSTRVRV